MPAGAESRRCVLESVLVVPSARKALGNALTHEVDMPSEAVQVLGVGKRRGNAVDGTLDLLESLQKALQHRCVGIVVQLQLDLFELRVPAIDAGAHAPTIQAAAPFGPAAPRSPGSAPALPTAGRRGWRPRTAGSAATKAGPTCSSAWLPRSRGNRCRAAPETRLRGRTHLRRHGLRWRHASADRQAQDAASPARSGWRSAQPARCPETERRWRGRTRREAGSTW